MTIDELLRAAVERGASDLHLKAGAPPMMRVRGALLPLPGQPSLDLEALRRIAEQVVPSALRASRADHHDLDFAYTIPGLGRFRGSAFQQRGATGLVFRVIPLQIASLADLRLPSVLAAIAREERGLVLVTGTTGSGKSTTLAALMDAVNQDRAAHIMTIEDPIEFLHEDKRSIINQREIGSDAESFAGALRSALRQDPDVIMVGEMRDRDTIETALLAAETGHLVVSTLHTVDATETINRIVAAFPPHQHDQVRAQLGSVLKAVISQRLVPTADGQARVPAVEVLINTPLIRGYIVDRDKTPLIASALSQGTSQYGMQTFDQSLYDLCQQRLISVEEALRWATHPDDFVLRVRGVVSGAAPAPARIDQAPPGISRFGA